MLKIHGQDTYLTNSKNLPMGDGRPTCNTVLTSGSVGMGIPMGIPMGFLWVWDGYGEYRLFVNATQLKLTTKYQNHK